MEAICALVIGCAAELWSMLPTHKSKRFHEFHARPDGVRWADMIHTQVYGQPPSTGPRYHHESIVKGSSWMKEDNLCVFHFEGNRGRVLYNERAKSYEARSRPWGNITVIVTKDFKLKTSFYKDPPPYPLDFHIQCNGYREITQPEIDAEIAELMVVMNEWFLTVLRKRHQMLIKGMKRELAEAVWHPRRVARWVEAGVELEAL
jgi:hypothetical protein